MSYSPEPGRDPRPAPWASPSTTDTQDTQGFDGAPPADNTRVDRPVDDRSVAAHNGVHQPAADHGLQQPGLQQPGVQQPGVQQPGADQPTVDQPVEVSPGPQDPWAADHQPDHTQPVPASVGSYPYA